MHHLNEKSSDSLQDFLHYELPLPSLKLQITQEIARGQTRIQRILTDFIENDSKVRQVY